MSRTASMRPAWLQEPNFRSRRNILRRNIRRQHDHHATRSNVLLCELDGSDMRLKYAPVWSAEFNLVLRSYPKVQTFRDDWDDHATSSGYLELVLDFKEKPHYADFGETIEDPKGHVLVPFFVSLSARPIPVLGGPHAATPPDTDGGDVAFASHENTNDKTAA
jgi:hypothetical protein